MNIFVSHASQLLTDHEPHGDGRVAFEFIDRLASRGHILHVAGPEFAVRKRWPTGVTLHTCRPRTPFAAFYALEYMVRVRALYRRVAAVHDIDVIHQLNPVEAGFSYLVAAAAPRTPLVLGPFVAPWPPGAEAEVSNTTILGAIARWATTPLVSHARGGQERRAAALLLSTPAAVEALCNPRRQTSNHVLFGSGVDTKEFTPAAASDRERDPTVLFLANLLERKGILTLLDAFEEVHVQLPSARLRVAGGGPAADIVRARVAGMRSRANVELLGPTPREKVPDLMRSCSVYCLPSYGEPYGMSALEAMSCGKPVVATAAGGLQHLVDPMGGRTVPVRDPKALAAALIELLASERLRTAMGEHNRRKILAHFSWDAVIDRLEAVYRSLRPTGNGATP